MMPAEEVTTDCVGQEWRMTAITLEKMAVDLEHRAREMRRQAEVARRHAARYEVQHIDGLDGAGKLEP